MKLITAAQLDGYSPRKDKCVTLRFITQEKSPEEIMHIHQMLDGFGYLYFRAEEQLSKEEIDELDALETDLYDQPKTQSQRIRGVLFKMWEQDNKGYSQFKDFYKHHTEKIIEWLKKKLD
jgi:hypothetical protein